MSIRRTLTKSSDPTDEDIATALLELKLLSAFDKRDVIDLYQVFEHGISVLAKPSTWEVSDILREQLKKEQQLLVQIVRNNTVEGDSLKKAITNSFKLHDLAKSLSIPVTKLIQDNKIAKIIDGMEHGIDVVKELINSDDVLREVLGIPEDLYPEQVLAQLSNEQRKILTILSQVNQVESLKVGSCPSQIEDQLSTRRKEIPIAEYSELTKIGPTEWVHPLHEYKTATKAYALYKGVKTIESKQTLLLLIDGSASMDEEWKQAYVKAILINRGMSVLDGRSELYVAQFREEICTDWIKISTKEEFREYFVTYKKQLESAGTEVGRIIAQVEIMLLQHNVGGHIIETKRRPHLLVINDGNDSVNEKFRANCTVHAFVLGTTNKALKKLVERSGGHYQMVLQ